MTPINLLIADDEPIVATFIKTLIAKQKLPVAMVHEAANGREAIALSREHTPDLYLLDICMPGINGLQAAQTILHERPEARVIMVTAYNDFEYAREALRCGVIDYLLKPLDPDAFARLVLEAATIKGAQGDSAPRPQHHLAPQPADFPVESHPLVASVAAYIEARLDEPIRLDDIARAVFMSPSHCSRQFKKYAGCALADFVAARRLEKAIELLRATFLSITEVGSRTGFINAAHFTAWFRKQTGQTPLQYRKQVVRRP